MKIVINKEVIKSLNPCADRYENYLKHYQGYDVDIQEFLMWENISHKDKLWVSLRLIPRFLVEVFAIDCAVSAQSYAANADYTYAAAYAADAADAANADYADYAADAANYAADAANYAAADANYAANYAANADSEKERQLCAIEYLIINSEG